MRTARRNTWEQGIRINYVAPCWIGSAIRTAEYEAWLTEWGIEFGERVDCAGAMVRISCDKSVNGACLVLCSFFSSSLCSYVSCPLKRQLLLLHFLSVLFLMLFPSSSSALFFFFLITGFLRYQPHRPKAP